MKNITASYFTRDLVAQASRLRSFTNLTGGTPVLQNFSDPLEGDAPSAPKLQARSAVSWAFAFFFLIALAVPGLAQSTYNLITSTSDLVAGEKYLIVSGTNGAAQALGRQNTNNRGQAAVTVTSNSVVTTPASAAADTSAFEITIGGSEGAWTLFDAVNNTFLAATSSTQNYLQGNVSSANRTWTISFNGTAAVLTSQFNAFTRNLLRHNSSSSLFSCYASGQNPVYLFKKAAVSPTAPTITSFSPTSGVVGDSITITGTNFDGSATVSFNGTSSTNVTFTNNTSLTATVPAGAASGPITVTVGAESGVSSTSFTVVNPSAPVISTNGTFTAFSTTSGNASAAQTLGVTGTNLTASITATAPTGFEVSTDGTSFASNATITQSSGSASATLSVRIASTASVGALTGNLTLTSTGATSVSIPLSGNVTAPPAVPISIAPGATVSENFSSLGNSSTASLPSGWKVDKNTTERTLGTYVAAVTATERAGGANLSSGASNGIYNFGSSPTDRAVGGLSSGSASKSVNLYAALQNTAGSSISGFTISYNAERYRNGSNPAGFAIQLYYSTNGTSWTSAGSGFLSAFAANADNNGAATVPIETLAVTAASLPVSLDPGATLYLAWNYSVATGSTTSSAQALGVSDIQITAAGGSTPAPVVTPATIGGTVGTALSYSINATNSPTSYGNTTALPAGLSLNATTGLISGTPATAGNTTTTVTATNSGGTGNATLTFVIAPAPSSPFDTWVGGNVTMTPAVLSLYAIGGGSYNGSVAPEAPVLTTTGGNLSLTAIVRTDDPALTVSGQSLTDLVLGTWSSSEVTSTTEGLDQTGLAAQGLERRRYSVPATGSKKFLRLRAVYAGDN